MIISILSSDFVDGLEADKQLMWAWVGPTVGNTGTENFHHSFR